MSEELVMDEGKIKSAKTITTVIYVLQAISFLIGITFIVAVVINYIKKGDVHGTWLDSHFRWQIRTFWFSLLWLILGLVTYFIVVGYFIIIVNIIWIIYRVVRGWLHLLDGKEMYT